MPSGALVFSGGSWVRVPFPAPAFSNGTLDREAGRRARPFSRPESQTIWFLGRGFAVLCRLSAVLVCHSPLSRMRMEHWHPTGRVLFFARDSKHVRFHRK